MLAGPDHLAIGFRLGLIPRAEIINWADSQIRELERPPIELIELACMTSGPAGDVLGKLSELSLYPGSVEALPDALALYTQRLREQPHLGPAVAKGLWELGVEAGYDVPEELVPMLGFDEDYWLARTSTFGRESDVYASLLLFCESFERGA